MRKRKPIFLLASLLLGSSLHAVPMKSLLKGKANDRNALSPQGRMHSESRDRGASENNNREEGFPQAPSSEATEDDVGESACKDIKETFVAQVGLQVLQEKIAANEAYEAAREEHQSLFPKRAALAEEESQEAEIKSYLRDKFIAELALETLQGAQQAANEFAEAYRDQAILKDVQETFLEALKADREARMIKKKTFGENLNRESAAYQHAGEAWEKTELAYEDLQNSGNKNLNALFKTYLCNVRARRLLWKAHFYWIRAWQQEKEITGSLTLEQAEEMESLWDEAVKKYDGLLDEAKHFEEKSLPSLVANRESANERREAWEEKIKQIEAVALPQDPSSAEERRLKKLARDEERRQKQLQAIKLGEGLLAYEHWSLPGDQEKERESFEKGETEEIAPPKLSLKKLETIGKELFERVRKARHDKAIVAAGKSPEENEPFLSLVKRQEKAKEEILKIAAETSEENKKRCEAREKADQLYSEAARAVAEKKVINEEEGTKDKAAADYANFPKYMSVVGSTAIGYKARVEKKTEKPIKTLDSISKEATAADQEWEKLVRESEEKRLAAGGLTLPFQDALLIWEDADKKVSQERNKKEKAQEQSTMAREHRQHWESNVRRWSAAMKVEQYSGLELKEFRRKIEELREDLAISNAQKGPRSLQSKTIQAELEDAEKRESDLIAAGEQVQAQWLLLGSQHHTVIKKEREEERVLALEKLKKADHAVVNLWSDVVRPYDDDQFQEEQDASLLKNVDSFNFKQLLHESFEKVKQQLEAAEKAYNKAKTAERKAQIKPLYEQLDSLEKESQKKYQTKIQEAALEDACRGVSVTKWQKLLDDLEQKKEEQEKKHAVKVPSADLWVDEYLKSLEERASAIYEATRLGLEYFKKEKERLANIGELFKAILEARKNVEKKERQSAAAIEKSWNMLTDEERYLHDQEVRSEDEAACQESATAIATATEAARIARARVRVTPSNLFIQEAQKAQSKLEQRQYEEQEKERAIEGARWVKRSVKERRKELQDKITFAIDQTEKAKGEEKILWKKAEEYWRKASEREEQEEIEHVLFFKKAGKAIELAAKYESNAEKEKLIGNHESEKLWQEAAKKAAVLADQYVQITLLIDSEKREIKDQINKIDQEADENLLTLEQSADYLEKSASAWQKEKYQHAEIWRKAAGEVKKIPLYKSNINNFYITHIKQNVLSSRNENLDITDASLIDSSDCFKKSISYLTKAAEAESFEVAELWMKAAEEINTLAITCYLTEQKELQKNEIDLFYNKMIANIKAADQLGFAANFLEKKIEAEAAGQNNEATEWGKAFEESKQSVDLFKLASSSYVLGNFKKINQAQYWLKAAKSNSNLAESLAKAIEGEFSHFNNSQELWKKSASLYQNLVRYWKQVAKAYDRGSKLFQHFTIANRFANASAEELNKANLAIEQAILATNKKQFNQAELVKKIAAQYQCSADYFSQAANIYAQGSEEGNRFNEAAGSIARSADILNDIPSLFEKYTLAAESNQSHQAAFLEKLIEQYKSSADYYYQAANAYLQTDEAKGKRLDKAADAIKGFIQFYSDSNEMVAKLLDADSVDNVANIAISDKKEKIDILKKLFDQWKIATSYLNKAAEAMIIELPQKGDESKSWIKAGSILLDNAQHLVAFRTEAKNNEEESRLFSRFFSSATDCTKDASEFFSKSAKAFSTATPIKIDEAKKWYNAGLLTGDIDGEIFYEIAKHHNKDIIIEKNWNSVFNKKQRAVSYFNKAAEAFAIETSEKANEGNDWYNAGLAAIRAAEGGIGEIRAIIEEKKVLANYWNIIENENNRASGCYIKSIGLTVKTNEGMSWNKAGESALLAAERMQNAIKENSYKNETPATSFWHDASNENKWGSDLFTLAAEAYSIGTPEKINEAISWDEAGSSKLLAAQQIIKSKEINDNYNHQIILSLWNDAISLAQLSSEYYTIAAGAYSIGTPEKISEAESWRCAALVARRSSEGINKVIEANCNKNEFLANKFNEVVHINKSAIELFLKAAQIKSTQIPTKKNKFLSWFINSKQIMDEENDLHQVAYNKLLAAEQKKKDIEREIEFNKAVQKSEQSSIADESSSISSNQEKLSSELDNKELKGVDKAPSIIVNNGFLNSKKIVALNNVTIHQEKVANFLEKSTALLNLENEDLSTSFNNQSVYHQHLASYYLKSSEFYSEDSEEKDTPFDQANEFAYFSATHLNKAATFLEKASTPIILEKPRIIAALNSLAIQHQLLAKYYYDTAESYVQQKEEVINLFDKAYSYACSSDYRLNEAANAIEKAEKSNNSELAIIFIDLASRYNLTADYDRIAAEKCVQGCKEEEGKFIKASSYAFSSAHRLNQAIDVIKKYITLTSPNELEVVVALKNLASRWQLAAEYNYQAAIEHANSNNEKALQFSKANSSAGSSAYCLNEAATAVEKKINSIKLKKLTLSTIFEKLCLQWQLAAKYARQAAEAYVDGNEKEAIDCSYGAESAEAIAYRLNEIAKKLDKIDKIKIDYEEKAKTGSLSKKWHELAVLQERSIEPFTQAAGAFATGKTEEGNSWDWTGASFYFSAAKQAKAIEAEEAGKPDVAKQWREAAELQLQAVEYFIKAAQVHALEKTEEGTSWYNAGYGFYKAGEAHAAGNMALATEKIAAANEAIRTAQRLAAGK